MSIAAAETAPDPAASVTDAPPPPLHEPTPDEPPVDRIVWAQDALLAAMARITDCQRREREVRAHRALRATTCWDDDRRLAIEHIARSLRRSPSLTVARLARTLHGTRWLIARWQRLREQADAPAGWTQEHQGLAHQLLGHDPVWVSPEIPPWQEGETPADLADRMLTELSGRLPSLVATDEEERALAQAGVEIEPDKVLSALRREEAAAWKVVHWAEATLANEPAAPGRSHPPAEPGRQTVATPREAPAPLSPAGPTSDLRRPQREAVDHPTRVPAAHRPVGSTPSTARAERPWSRRTG